MSARRIWILFQREIGQSATNFFFVVAIVVPLVLTLLVTLVFGDLFSSTPRLGLYAADDTQMVAILSGETQIRTIAYPSEAALRDSVQQGVNEMGLVFGKGFDAALQSGAQSNLNTLIWGEAPARSRLIVESAAAKAAQQIIGTKAPVSLSVTQLGDVQNISMVERLLPFIVLYTIIVGGVMVPAASLVDEKQKRTLNALNVTPATLADVYAAKALLGVGISMVMGIVILVLNQAFGSQPILLVSTLVLGAVASSIFGVILGSLVKDINVLLATIKASGLILFAPGLIMVFPQVPQWIAYLFPTFYVMDPVLQVSQKGAGLSDIGGEIAVLLAIIAVMLFILASVIERQQKRLALAS
jgi:ABC-2 type transport system permease protein